jgi:hypothetical protein
MNVEDIRKLARYPELQAEVERLSKQSDHYERALREIESSPYSDYFYGVTRTLSDAERSYRTGVADGHRAAASVARDALELVSSHAKEK